jgi:hypothetical protein
MPFKSIVMLVYVVVLLLTVPILSFAADDFPYTCAFEKTIIIGSSISANLMPIFGLASAPFIGPAIYGLSPGQILLDDYAGRMIFKNYSAFLGDPTGAEQLNTLFGEHMDELREATAIIGIDAFYWDASWGTSWATDEIVSFIQFAATNEKTLILGTVPLDTVDQVRWSNVLPKLQAYLASLKKPRYLWKAPQPQFAAAINQVLRDDCIASNGCYLVDFDKLQEKLKAGQKLTLNNGQSYDLYGLRPDGVHFSPAGTEYTVEEILRQLHAQTPPMDPKICGTGMPSLPLFYGSP